MNRIFPCAIVCVTLLAARVPIARGDDLDATFGNGGVVTTPLGQSDAAVSALVVQPDGKIVAAGGAGGHFALARYNADGRLDPSFGPGAGGTVLTSLSADTGDYAYASDLILQPDAKLVAAGFVGPLGKFGQRFAVARYYTNGSLDASFGTGGVVTTAFGDHTDDWAFGVALQPDGKLVVAGVSWGQSEATALARYNADGSLDPTFGNGGLVRSLHGGLARAVVVQPDGKLVVAGRDRRQFRLLVGRYNADGSLNTSFGNNNGITGFDQFMEATSILRQPDGKLVAAAYQFRWAPPDSVGPNDVGYPSASVLVLARLNANGAVDSAFGDDGTVTSRFEVPFADAMAVALAPDNKLVAAGRLYDGTQSPPQHFGLARYNVDGSPDLSFGPNGTVAAPAGEAYALVALGNGDIVAAGVADPGSSSCFRLARYTNMCGNRTLDAGEACDDGNRVDDDGCDASCLPSGCGNGTLDAGEACDDGNHSDNDACASNCALNLCGDLLTNAAVEACDDGNVVSGDGCDANCTPTRCGNGVATTGEECDDGNPLIGDGCDANCLVEHCGDQRLEGNEQCDDGNTTDGDACASNCRWTLVSDSYLRPPIPVSVRLGRHDSEQVVLVRPGVSWDVPPDHTSRLIASNGDCPPGTVSVNPNDPIGQLVVHVVKTAFPAATATIPQRCTFNVSARVEPPDVGDVTPENNEAVVELSVYTRGLKAPMSAFALDSARAVRVYLSRGLDSITRRVPLRATPPTVLRDGSATLTVRDGTCPAGTVRVFSLGRSQVGVTIPSAGFRTTSKNLPARCTALITARVPGAVAESQHTTRLVIDVIDANDF